MILKFKCVLIKKEEKQKLFMIDIFDGDMDNKLLYCRYKIPMTNNIIYIPIDSKKVISECFNMYNASHIFRRLHRYFLKFIFRVVNIGVINKDKVYICLNNKIRDSIDNFYRDYTISIYTGTETIDGSYTMQLFSEDKKIKSYIKIPKYKEGVKFLLLEKNNIEYLNSIGFDSENIPKIIYFDKKVNMLIQGTKDNLRRDSGKLGSMHIDFLSEIYQKSKFECKFEKSDIYKHINLIKEETDDKEIRDLMIEILYILKTKFCLDYIQCCFAHRDFHTNNIKKHKKNIFVYDWESAGFNIIYYDLFFYIYYKNRKLSSKKIVNKILNNKAIDVFNQKNNIKDNTKIAMLILYLCEMIYKYKFEIKLDYNDELITINLDMIRDIIKIIYTNKQII